MPPTTSRGIQLPRLPRQLTAESPVQIEDRADHTAVVWSSLNLPGQHATYLTLEQCHLRKVGVPQSRLPAARLTDVRVESSDWSSVTLERARLRRVEWLGCRLQGAQFIEALFDDVRFQDGNCNSAIFVSAVFKNARFDHCILTQASFAGATLDGVVFDQCDLTGADFRDASLEGADLRGSTLSGIQVGAKELHGAIVDPAQAIQIAGLLGLVVREPGVDR